MGTISTDRGLQGRINNLKVRQLVGLPDYVLPNQAALPIQCICVTISDTHSGTDIRVT